MKYVKTKERICEITDLQYEFLLSNDYGEVKWLGLDDNDSVAISDIIKHGNTIEELCDEFVVVYTFSGNRIHYGDLKWALEKAKASGLESGVQIKGVIFTEQGETFVEDYTHFLAED